MADIGCWPRKGDTMQRTKHDIKWTRDAAIHQALERASREGRIMLVWETPQRTYVREVGEPPPDAGIYVGMARPGDEEFTHA